MEWTCAVSRSRNENGGHSLSGGGGSSGERRGESKRRLTFIVHRILTCIVRYFWYVIIGANGTPSGPRTSFSRASIPRASSAGDDVVAVDDDDGSE